jgi:hypothetical protein
MKVFVMHDKQGNIRSVGGYGGALSEPVRLKPHPGYHITEVEAPNVKDEQDYQQLRELIEHFRIDIGPGQPRLIRK